MDIKIYADVCRMKGHNIQHFKMTAYVQNKVSGSGLAAINGERVALVEDKLLCVSCGAESPFEAQKSSRTSGPSGRRKPKPAIGGDPEAASQADPPVGCLEDLDKGGN